VADFVSISKSPTNAVQNALQTAGGRSERVLARREPILEGEV
jgi:hypothetical protein